jgi:hypothetical protein
MTSDTTYGDSLSISFDLPDRLLEVVDQFKEDLQKSIPEILSATVDQLEILWKVEATNSMKDASGYNTSFSRQDITPFHIVLENNHKAVWFLELGTAPFDLKRMLDTSDKVKVSKDGKRYIRIPFEGKVKDYVAAGISQKDIQRMKGSTFTLDDKGRGRKIITVYGDRLQSDIGRKRKYFTVLNATRDKFPNKSNSPNMGFTPFTEHKAATTIDYTWKSSPYQNAVKMVDFQGKTQGMKTFRTISDNSDSDSWINPGIHASHIAEKSVEAVKPQFVAEMSRVLQPLFDNFEQSMKNAGFD